MVNPSNQVLTTNLGNQTFLLSYASQSQSSTLVSPTGPISLTSSIAGQSHMTLMTGSNVKPYHLNSAHSLSSSFLQLLAPLTVIPNHFHFSANTSLTFLVIKSPTGTPTSSFPSCCLKYNFLFLPKANSFICPFDYIPSNL